MSSQRDSWIDAGRGLAASSVVLFHLNAVDDVHAGGAWAEFWAYGHLGVAVFFVLSGWCITGSWVRSNSAKEFAVRRFRRIYPAYFASWLLVLLLALLFKLLTGVNDITRLPGNSVELICNLTLTTQPVSGVPTINWVYWSLSCEVAFYGLLALLLLAPARFRLGALAALHCALCAWAAAGSSPDRGPFFFVNYWPLFGIGSALYLLQNHARWSILMLLACAGYSVAGLLTLRQVPYISTALLTAALLLLLENFSSPRRILAPLQRLGAISYSLYLIHVPVGVLVLLRFTSPLTPDLPALIVQQLAILGLLILAAAGFHRLFERPFLRQPPSTALGR